MGIASLVLGIVALCCSFWGYGSYIALCLGIPGIVLGAVGHKRGMKCAVAGLIVSIVAVVCAGIVAIACSACVGCAACASALE